MRRFLDGRSIAARPASFLGKSFRWSKRRPALAHGAALVNLAPSRGGCLLAASDKDSYVRIWDVSTGRLQAICRHEALIHQLALSPTTRILATISDRKIHFWETTSGSPLAAPLAVHGEITALGFTADGRCCWLEAASAGMRCWLTEPGGKPTLAWEKPGPPSALMNDDCNMAHSYAGRLSLDPLLRTVDSWLFTGLRSHGLTRLRPAAELGRPV